MRKQRTIVRVKAGPSWAGGPPEEQPGWDEHAAFVDDLVDRGIVVEDVADWTVYVDARPEYPTGV